MYVVHIYTSSRKIPVDEIVDLNHEYYCMAQTSPFIHGWPKRPMAHFAPQVPLSGSWPAVATVSHSSLPVILRFDSTCASKYGCMVRAASKYILTYQYSTGTVVQVSWRYEYSWNSSLYILQRCTLWVSSYRFKSRTWLYTIYILSLYICTDAEFSCEFSFIV